MKVAALDLGTNTFLMLIAEVVDGKLQKINRDEIEVTRLGQGVHQNRMFHQDALMRTEECFRRYSQIIQQEKVDEVIAVATSAARDVGNREEFFALGRKYGIPIAVIPGQLEADLTFLGATFDLPTASGRAVIDVGGGSTEIIGRLNDRVEGFSFDVGSVRLTEMFITKHPIQEMELQNLEKHVQNVFNDGADKLPKGRIEEIIAVAGTPTTLAAVIQEQDYSDERVHGYQISTAELKVWQKKLAALSVDERQKLKGMDPKRADVIVAGICILAAAIQALGADRISVSTRGVRFGAALAREKILRYLQ